MRKRASCLAASALISLTASAGLSVPADALPPDDPSIAQGHDFIPLLNAALKIKAKSEFESGDEYRSRREQEASMSVYGSVSVRSKLALRLGVASSDKYDARAAYYKFDAEKQQLSACLPFSALGFASTERMTISRATKVRLAENIKVTGTYTGRNAFNVAVKVRRQTLRAVDLYVPVASLSQECAPSVAMSSVDARRLLKSAVMVVVGHLEPPFAKQVEFTGNPQIDNPIDEHAFIVEAPFVADELVLVSPSDGVIYRQPAPPPAQH